MPVINGVKYACEPCMRGHRSSKCTHGDRILVRVRKPGRPLSSCPHSVGDCHCGGVRVAIPKVSACACGPISSIASTNALFPVAGDAYGRQGQQVLPSQEVASSSEIQKAKRRKSNTLPASLGMGLEGKTENRAYGSVDLSSIPNRFDPSTPSNPGFSGARIETLFDPDILGSARDNQTDSTFSGHHPSNEDDSRTVSVIATSAECCTNPTNVGQSLPTPSEQGVSLPASTPPSPSSDGDGRERKLSSSEGMGSKEESSSLHRSLLQEKTPETYRYASGGKRIHDLGSGQSGSRTCCSSTATGKSAEVQQTAPLMRSACCATPARPQPSVCHNECRTIPSQHSNQSYGINKPILSLQSQQLQQQMPFQSPISPLFPYQNTGFQPQPLTTMYTFPPTYSTFQHPLKPQELAFLHSNPQHFAQSVPHMVAAGVFGEMAPAAAGAAPLLAHNCHCGNDCDCLGCAAHPYNDRTLNFVRSLRDIMAADGGQGDPRHHRQSHQDDQPPTAMGKSGACCGGSGTGTHLRDLMPRHNIDAYSRVTGPSQRVITGPQPPSPTGPSLPVLPPRMSTKVASPTKWFKMGEGDVDNEGEESISPSAFFHVDYPIGGCAEEKNGCFCGEGCTCVGCLTHGGHDGIALSEFPPGSLVNGGNVDQGPPQSDPTKRYSNMDEEGQSFAFMDSLTDHGGY